MKLGERLTHCKRGHPYDEENTITFKDGRRTCRQCRNLIDRKSYQSHRNDRISRTQAWTKANMPYVLSRNTARRKTTKLELIALKGGKCVRCGYDEHPAALDFDHIDPAGKSRQISYLINDGVKREVLLAELEKCQLLCANCHRIKTHDPSSF